MPFDEFADDRAPDADRRPAGLEIVERLPDQLGTDATAAERLVDGEMQLLEVNAAYIHSDQHGDVERYEKFLAPDFVATLPDLIPRDRQAFLEMIATERPFTDLRAYDVKVRILSDVALIHGRVTYTTEHDGKNREARYTDIYQRRDGEWLCVAADVVALGE